MAEHIGSRVWNLPGPAVDLLDLRAVAHYLGVDVKTIQRMILDGEFPAGLQVGKKQTWTGADIAAYVQLRGRFRSQKVPESARKNADKLGQIGTKSDKSGQTRGGGSTAADSD